MIYPSRQVTLRSRIPTVRVHVVTDDGEVSVHARWKERPIDLQRRISYLMRQGQAIFLEDEWGRTVCLRPECIQGATVYGRRQDAIRHGERDRDLHDHAHRLIPALGRPEPHPVGNRDGQGIQSGYAGGHVDNGPDHLPPLVEPDPEHGLPAHTPPNQVQRVLRLDLPTDFPGVHQ